MKMIEDSAQKLRTAMNFSILLAAMVGLSSCAGSSSSTSNSGVPKSSTKTKVAAKSTSAANAFKISFDWESGMKKCFSRVSPPIQLMNVPAGTTSFKVAMEDADSSYAHGGGKVNYSGGSVIPAGALKTWEGPCPPSQHTYTFKVTAYGGEKVRAKYSQKYPK